VLKNGNQLLTERFKEQNFPDIQDQTLSTFDANNSQPLSDWVLERLKKK